MPPSIKIQKTKEKLLQEQKEEDEKWDYEDKVSDSILNSFRNCIISPGRGEQWRIRNKNIFLLYHEKLSKVYLRGILEEKCGGIKTLYVVSVPSKYLTYTLVYINTVNAVNTSSSKYFYIVDGEDNFPSFTYIISDKKSVDATIKCLNFYNNKLDEFDKDPDLKEAVAETKSIAKLIWECESEQDALDKFTKKIGDALGVRALWESRPNATESKKESINNIKLFKFQQIFWEMLLADDWNYRRLIWIVDEKGGKGKSTFCKKFRQEFEGVIVLKTLCGASHMATLINERKKHGLKTKYILVDLPRAAETHKMWDTVECLMDGMLTVQKYKSTECKMDEDPRIMIHANWKPSDAPDVEIDDPESTHMIINGKKVRVKAKKKGTVSVDRWNFGNLVPYHNPNDYKKELTIYEDEGLRFSNLYNVKWRNIIEKDSLEFAEMYKMMRILLKTMTESTTTISKELHDYVILFNTFYTLLKQKEPDKSVEDLMSWIVAYGELDHVFEPVPIKFTIYKKCKNLLTYDEEFGEICIKYEEESGDLCLSCLDQCSEEYPVNYTVKWENNPDYDPNFDDDAPPVGTYHLTTREEFEARKKKS